MAKAKTSKVEGNDGFHYKTLAFRDYIAARCLLLNQQYIQGATLASTALEKYLKCILATTGIKTNLHLDYVEKFKQLMKDQGIAIFDELDPVFVDTLSKAYSLRYYDSPEVKIFGFLMWQLLGELDSTVAMIESRLNVKSSQGNPAFNPYQNAIDKKDRWLCEDNHVILKIDKKEFMMRQGPAVMLRLDKTYGEILIEASDGMAPANYDGQIISLVDIGIINDKTNSTNASNIG